MNAFDATNLGAISASTQTNLNGVIANLEGLHLQATMDLQTLGDQGVDTAQFAAELDDLGHQVTLLATDIVTMADSPAAISAFQGRAEVLKAKLLAVLRRTGTARSGAPELAQLKGFGWALGVLAVATAVGAYVWTHRSKLRRKRRR